MPKKETSNKTREWERDRRERLNETFNLLSTLLPSYDPSITRSKIEILQKAVAYISDLQKENRELIKSGKDQKCWKQVRQLKRRVENLLRRVQQLVRLLHDAGISIPPELPKAGQPSLPGKPPKWSNKIRQEDSAALLEKIKIERADKKKERTPLNVCGNKVKGSETKTVNIVTTVSNSSNINTVSTTSKTKLSRVTKINRKRSKERGKKCNVIKNPGCEELPTVTQLLGMSLNDIDVTPPVAPASSLPGSGDLSGNNLTGVTSNTPGTNVTVLASSIPQVPQGFIVIPKANSLTTTSKSHLPQSPCIMVAPATQAVSCSQQIQQPCVVMPSKLQATNIIKTSIPMQQPMPMVLSSTTSALENIAIRTTQKSDAVAVTNSHLLTAPIMATGIQTCPTPALLPTQGASLTGLGPGTLILANGSILPIFPSSQPASTVPRVLTPRNNTQIVMSSGSNIPAPVLPSQPVLLVQNKVHSTSDVVSTSNVKPRQIYSFCLPKPLKRKGVDSTRTSFANKVPISALTPRSNIVRSAVSSAQIPVNKFVRVNKSEDVRSIRQISDKKTNCVQKGTSRCSKTNVKIHKKKSTNNIKEVKNNLQSCESTGNHTTSQNSETPPADLAAKENVYEHARNNNSTTKVHENSSEAHENLNCISSTEQECEKDNDLTADSNNKRKRDTNEDVSIKSSKQIKSTHQADSPENILPTLCQPPSYTTGSSSIAEDTFTCAVDGQTKKTNEDSGKVYGGIDNYSIDSICRSSEKNDLVTDMNRIDSNSTLETCPEKSFDRERGSTSQDKALNCGMSVANNNEGVTCDESDKLSTSLSYSNTPSTLSSLECIKGGILNKQILNSSNDFNASPCSSSENCMKSPTGNQSERQVGSEQNLYNSTVNTGSKNIGTTSNDLKHVASVDNTNCDATEVASVAKTSQNSEASAIANDVFQQRTCNETDISVTYAHPVSSDVHLFSPKTQGNSTSGDKPCDVTSIQADFGSENVAKIPDVVITERTLNNESSSMPTEVSVAREESAPGMGSTSDVKYPKSDHTVILGTCKVGSGNNNTIENSENTKEMEKSKNDFSEKDTVSSELSSNTEYNTFTSVSENNVSVCSTTNKMFRNPENLDLGASTNSSLCLSLQNNELSNDLFASLHVPSGGQHSESISPTAAFLLAFPLVSTSKVSDIIGDSQDDVGSDSLQGTSTLLQIGSLDSDHHSEAIISRSPTFHSSNSSNKILPQTTLCQKDSRAGHEEMECQQFLSPERSSKIDRNLEKTKIECVKFPESQNETDKTSNKNWMTLQTPSHSETTTKTSDEVNNQRNINAQSFTTECLETQLQNREMTEACTKGKALEQSCTFNAPKDISNAECTSGNISAQSSQPTNSNLPSFTVSQFVSPIFDSKVNTAVSTKQDQTPQISSAMQVTSDRSINFSDQTATKGEDRNFRSTDHSNSGSASFTLRKDVIEQATMTEDVRPSHPISLESSNKIKQSSSLPYSSGDCGGYSATSQSGYMLSNSLENEKYNIPSFSVAHNSSNFSILSWTTLSPTSTATNTNQYDGFGAQNSAAVATTHNNYMPVSKKQNKTNCPTEAHTIMTSSSVPEICQPQHKQSEQGTLSAHTINKISESFSSSLLQNTDNHAPENQTYLHHYLSDQRKMQNSAVPSSISSVTSQGSQLCTSGKVPDSEQQHRPPVNWMTTPDLRGAQHSVNILPSNSVGDRTLPPSSTAASGASMNAITSKDNQFCSISNNQNAYISCISTTLPTFDTRTYTSNSFYGAHSVHSQNSPSNYYQSRSHNQSLGGDPNHNHGNKLHLTSSLNRITDIHVGQSQVNDTYTVPWLQKKSNSSSVCSTELGSSNFISSSLPTLVGDLALGTNYPLSVNDDEQGNKGPQSTNFHVTITEKKSSVCSTGNNPLEDAQTKQVQTTTKNNDHNKDQNTVRNSIQDFRNTSQSSSSSFLSVSQLVNQAHPCESSTRGQTVSRHSNHITHQIVLPNKQNTCQPRSHQLSNLPAATDKSKEQINSLNTSDKEISQKSRPDIEQSCVNFRISESSASLPHSREETRKIESSQGIGNNHYIQEITSTVTLSHSSSIFSVSSSSQAAASHSVVSWPSGNVVKQRNSKIGSSGCKAPASSYSAEALIGLNSPQITDRGVGTVNDSRGNKVISLPPPVVSERFCRHQNYPPPSAARSLQVPPPFSAETILPSNYFTPVELQTPHPDANSTGPQNVSNTQSNHHSHQNQHGFNTFTSSASQSRASAVQCNSVLYTHSDFMSSVGTAHSNHSLPPVSLPCNFLPDLGTNNSYTTGILPDSGNPFLFPSSTIPVTRGSSACHNSGSGKQNLTHLHGSTQADTTGASISGGHEGSNQVVPTLPLGDKESYSENPLRCNIGTSVSRRTVTSDTDLLQQNTVAGGNICSSSKQRLRKRTSESITPSSSSGLGGLMDLGYLGIPPVISSPLLQDDSTFINHSGGFLASGSQHTTPSLYSGAPTPSQGSFYPTPHSHGQSSTSLTASHASHLTVNSGSFTTQTTRGLQLGNMVSPSTVNSSGTSLTNFNLSTIFPEINEKQVPNHTYNSSGSKEAGPLLSSLPVPSLPTSAPPPPHPQLNNSSSNHTRQPATLLLPPVSSYTHRQSSGEAAICLPPPPPPVPLHSSVTFNNILNSSASQMCQMQWR